MTPTIDEQIAEVEREVALRKRVYPKWVREKKLGQVQTNHRLANMEAVLATLKQAKGWRFE